MQKYVMFDHTADIGIEISGRTKKELFAHAAYALFDILIQHPDNKGRTNQRTQERLKISNVEGTDVEDLLINFLRELLYLFNGMGWVVNQSEIIECSKKRLVTNLMTEPYNNKRHLIKTEIKAVTYHGLSVVKDKSGWKARVIFDV